MAAVIKPLSPNDAVAAFQARASNPIETFSWQDIWEEEHTTGFTVAKSAGFDILNDIQSAFEDALANGGTAQTFAKQLTPILQAKGWWGKQLVTDPLSGDQVAAQLGSTSRLQKIFDTNMRVSYAAGHWASFERNKRTRPYLRYVALLDDRTRPTHRARHNLVLPVDDPYWNTWAPPCGWNCRCTLQSLSQADLDRLRREGEDLKYEPPADTYRTFTNNRTGEISRVPEGIDPGWAYNPGKAGYQARVNKAFADKIAASSPEMIAAAVDERVGSDDFARFVDAPQGSMPVIAIPQDVAQATASDIRVAVLQADTMTAQQLLYPDLTLDDYRALPSLSDPTLVIEDNEGTSLLRSIGAGMWRLAVLVWQRAAQSASVSRFETLTEEQVADLLKRPDVHVRMDRR